MNSLNFAFGGNLGGVQIRCRIYRPGNGYHMLYYSLVFLVVAIVAGLLGFGAIAFAAAGIAKLLFFIFLILFLVSMITHLGRGQRI